MGRPTTYYGTDDLELVKRVLSGILSCTKQEAGKLARKSCPFEVEKLASVFRKASEDMHKWSDFVLAKVPREAWVKGPGDVDQISPHRAASLRYLSKDPLPGDGLTKSEHLRFRQWLFEKLVKNISGNDKKQYREMLKWVPHDTLGNSGLLSLPLSSDTAFGQNLLYLEGLMDMQVSIYESKWAASCGWPETETIPAKVTRRCSEAARDHLGSIIERWYKESQQTSDPNCFLALAGANLSANRILLEYAAIEARGSEAAKMTVDFVREMNRLGINEVPMVMDGHDAHLAAEVLRDLLTAWFGHGGIMLDSGPFFQRVMNPSDIDIAISWSQQLQKSYIRSRGGRGGPEQARAIHGGSNNLFIFAIVVVGAFYTKARTPYEFKGHKNPKYAVFPARSEVARGNRQSPPAHAEQLLLQAYGQLFFANSGWGLSAERIHAHAETASIKRSHVQQLIYTAVKNRSSGELLALHGRLQDVRERSEQERKLNA